MPPAKPRFFRAYRFTELPKNTTSVSLREALQILFTSTGDAPQENIISKLSVAPDQNDPNDHCIATVSFSELPEALKKCSPVSDIKLSLDIDGTLCEIQVDCNFRGMTTLHCYEPVVDIFAVPGLGSNAFGAWRSQTNFDMWLRDFLPDKVKKSRILIYGYNSDLTGPGAQSFASVLDLGKRFINDLKLARRQPDEKERPLILIGHSLGGLVVKQALIEAATYREVSPAYENLHDSFIGALFFGVPNRGLNDKFLHEIVKGQPNNQLITSLDPESIELRNLRERFTTLFNKKKYQFYSYFEQCETQLSRLSPINGKLELYGKTVILVQVFSATEAVPSQAIHNHIPLHGDHRSMIKFPKKTDSHFQQVSADILSLFDVAIRMQEKQSLKTFTPIRSQDSHPIRMLVPYQKIDKYTPRPMLENILGKTCIEERAVILLGPGGTGKTQLALNLAFQSRDTRSVLWIDGNTVESSLNSLASIGEALGLAKAGMNRDDTCQALHKWLGSNESGNWLAIVNNLTHPDDYTLKILTCEKGTLVVCTSDVDMYRKLQAHQLDCVKMTAEEARTTFHKYSRLDIDDKTLDDEDVIAIVRLLNHSPLAIAMGASFIGETKTPVAEYIETYRRSLPDHTRLSESPVLKYKKEIPTPAIMTAWDISVRRIKLDNSSAVDLLQLMSMLDSQNIPIDLLSSKVTGEMGLEKGKKFEAALGILSAFSFIAIYKDRICQVHSLIASWAREQMGERQEYFSKVSLSLIEEGFSQSNTSNLAKYVPHARAVLLHSQKVPKLVQQRMALQAKLVDILYQSKWLSEAKNLIEDCIEYYETSKKDGIEFANCNYQLALIEETNKKYIEAIECFKNAADGFAKNLGQNHRRTLNTLKRIALVLEVQCDYAHAILSYEKALEWSKITTVDSFTIDIIHHMGLVYHKQGRYDLAAEAYSKALEYSIKAGGEQHPYTLDIQTNLAITLRNQGQYEKALERFKRVFDAYAQLRGKTHKTALNVQGNIALVYEMQGRHDMALKTYKLVLARKDQFLGKNSPSTLSTLSNMALLLAKLNFHNEAIEKAHQVLEGTKTVLGDDDPATLDAFATCAFLHDSMGNVLQAKEHYEHACQRKAIILGPEHQSTLKTVAEFARLLVRLGSYEEALGMQSDVLNGYVAEFGLQHPHTVAAEYERAKTLKGLQRWDEARAAMEGLVELLQGQDAQQEILVTVKQDLENLGDRVPEKALVKIGSFDTNK